MYIQNQTQKPDRTYLYSNNQKTPNPKSNPTPMSESPTKTVHTLCPYPRFLYQNTKNKNQNQSRCIYTGELNPGCVCGVKSVWCEKNYRMLVCEKIKKSVVSCCTVIGNKVVSSKCRKQEPWPLGREVRCESQNKQKDYTKVKI